MNVRIIATVLSAVVTVIVVLSDSEVANTVRILMTIFSTTVSTARTVANAIREAEDE